LRRLALFLFEQKGVVQWFGPQMRAGRFQAPDWL